MAIERRHDNNIAADTTIAKVTPHPFGRKSHQRLLIGSNAAMSSFEVRIIASIPCSDALVYARNTASEQSGFG